MIDFENEESIGINDGNNVKKYKIIYADHLGIMEIQKI